MARFLASKLAKIPIALVVGLMMALPIGPMTALAESTQADDPQLHISDAERAAFVEYWLDVFARGLRSLEETPKSYDYSEYVQWILTQDVVNALKNFNDSTRREFTPEVAGPKIGISTADNPLVAFDGRPVTQEDVDRFYGGMVNQFVFHREEFFARIKEIVEKQSPSKIEDAFPDGTDDGTNSENLIRTAMENEPITHWANDLAEVVKPEGFYEPDVTMVEATPMPEPSDLTQSIPTSPFLAAPEASWRDPNFRLALPDLLAFLREYTNLPAGDILRDLGLLAETAESVVTKVEGTLDAFPEVYGPVVALEAVVNDVTGAITTLEPPLPLDVHVELAVPTATLPPELQAIVTEIQQETAQAQYALSINGVTVNGVWNVPQAVDVNGDRVPDFVVLLTPKVVDADAASGLVREVPFLTIERVGGPGVDITTCHAALPQCVSHPLVNTYADYVEGRLPRNGATTLDFTVAFYPPDSDDLVILDGGIAGAADHFEATVMDLIPSVDFGAANANGAFDLSATVRRVGGASTAFTVTAPAAPASASVSTRLSIAEEMATIRVRPSSSALLDANAPMTITALATTATDRLAVRVSSASMPAADILLDGTSLDVDTTEGSSLAIERFDYVGISTTAFGYNRLDLANAPDSMDAVLDATKVTLRFDAEGATASTIVGDVSRGAFDHAVWTSVAGAGREAGLDLAKGVAFTSDKAVSQVSAVVAKNRAAAMTTGVGTGVFLVRDSLQAFNLLGVKSTTISPDGANGYNIDIANAVQAPMLLDTARGSDSAQFLLSNLPKRASFEITPEGTNLGGSEKIDLVTGVMNRQLDGPAAPSTRSIVVLDDMTGTTAVSMTDATLNLFNTGSLGRGDVLGSNVLAGGQYAYQRLLGNHVLADVQGMARKYSAGLAGVSGSLTGGLFGPLGSIEINLNIAGQLCQSFGTNGNKVELCLSNVPRRIKLGIQALPSPVLTYDASDVINWARLSIISSNVNVAFTVLAIPKHIELALGAGSLTVSTDTRLGGIVFTASIDTTTLAAAILDLPTRLTFSWGAGGMQPVIPAGDAIGRAYLFLSRPGLSFLVDIVHIPNLTISWSNGAMSVGPVGDRIGSILVQLAVSDLSLVLRAVGVPGMSAAWNAGGGSFSTNGVLDSFRIQLVKGNPWSPELSLDFLLRGVPPATVGWGTNSGSLSLSWGKIAEVMFQFRAADLLLYLQALGVPTTTFSMSGSNLAINAPGGLDSLIAILAKGAGYYNPWVQPNDFVGLYLRPDSAVFGISAKLTGLKSVSYGTNAWTGERYLTVGFTSDKNFGVYVDFASSALIAFLDILFQNLPATTTLTFHSDGVSLSGTQASWWRPNPWIQGRLYIGLPSTFAETPEPRWPFETTGLPYGVNANTFINTATAGFATKWKIYAPLPTQIAFSKSTSGGIPSYSLNTGVSLGKLDLRTQLRVNLNTCVAWWCSPQWLDTMAVVYVSNLPSVLNVGQGLGSGYSGGSPSFSISSGQPIQTIFLGIRFDNQWYGSPNAAGGFPIWASLGDIPTSLSLTVGKSGSWSGPNMPYVSYGANAHTLDARFYLNIGALWSLFGKAGIIQAAQAGRAVPGWLLGLAQYDATGYLYLELIDIPGTGISIYRAGDTFVVDPQDSWNVPPLTRFFADFNLRLERWLGNSGCWICWGWITLGWYWNFGYAFEIQKLSLLLENLRYLSVDLGLETIVRLDGHLVFNFFARVGATFGGGVYLDYNFFGISGRLFCLCVQLPWIYLAVDLGFVAFQVNTYWFGINYFTLPYWCHWSWSGPQYWCHDHYYAGFSYTIPDHWQFDLPIAIPPWVPFRGLNLYSGTWHVIINPRILTCVNDWCWEVGRLIPIYFIIAYAYIRYFSLSGLTTWSEHHHH